MHGTKEDERDLLGLVTCRRHGRAVVRERSSDGATPRSRCSVRSQGGPFVARVAGVGEKVSTRSVSRSARSTRLMATSSPDSGPSSHSSSVSKSCAPRIHQTTDAKGETDTYFIIDRYLGLTAPFQDGASDGGGVVHTCNSYNHNTIFVAGQRRDQWRDGIGPTTNPPRRLLLSGGDSRSVTVTTAGGRRPVSCSSSAVHGQIAPKLLYEYAFPRANRRAFGSSHDPISLA